MIAREWLRGLPKAELHVHLEGTATAESYARIARRNGVAIDGDPQAAFLSQDFESFLRAFLRVVKVFRTPDDFAELAADYLERSAVDGVLHVELMLSPATQRRFVPGLDLAAMVRSVGAACAAARERTGISSLLLFDLVRNLGEEEAMLDLALAERCRDAGVAGVGLGGDERNFPARDFRRVYARARSLGLHRTVHAGEAADWHSIDDAVRSLHAERIGHGVAAAHHPGTMRLLSTHGVAVDCCPSSNVRTGAVASLAEHPIRAFYDAGIPVSLNSDDPAFFGASLLDEYALAAQRFSTSELATIAKTSFAASFAPEERKRRWQAAVDGYLVDAGSET